MTLPRWSLTGDLADAGVESDLLVQPANRDCSQHLTFAWSEQRELA